MVETNRGLPHQDDFDLRAAGRQVTSANHAATTDYSQATVEP